MTPDLQPETSATEAAALGRIAAVVERMSGIGVHDVQRRRLHRAVTDRMAELGEVNLAAYAGRVEREPGEWQRFIPDVAVGETVFFRDRARWTALEDRVLPSLAAGVAGRPLRLWSAGCATGEEAYGLAMVCARLGERLSGLEVEVVGSDLNPAALETARAAAYPERVLRELTPPEIDRFFEPCPEGRRVRPELRRRVDFEALNLVAWAEIGPWPARFDLILCQHVLIYFSPRVTERVLEAMARSLTWGGLLMVGHSETMRPPEGCVLEWIDGGCGFRRPRPTAGTGFASAEDDGPAPEPDAGAVLGAAWDDVEAERYETARDRLRALPERGDALRLAAWIAVCRGEWNGARGWVTRALAEDTSDPEAHFVAAMLAAHTEAPEAAVGHLRQAVYLDPGFAVAHFHLAELEAGLGRLEQARRAWRNAARAGAGDALRIRRYFGGFDAAAFAQACDGRRRAAGDDGA